MGGGLQWRPLVHVSDVSKAFIATLRAEKKSINGEIFNVGLDNFQVKNLAYLVRDELAFPIEIDIAPDDADKRDYNVNFSKIKKVLDFDATVSVNEGIREIYNELKSGKVDTGPKTVTVQWYKSILEAKELLDSVILNNRVI
jgi:nucleoside-diphosphate-sugar epimerase